MSAERQSEGRNRRTEAQGTRSGIREPQLQLLVREHDTPGRQPLGLHEELRFPDHQGLGTSSAWARLSSLRESPASPGLSSPRKLASRVSMRVAENPDHGASSFCFSVLKGPHVIDVGPSGGSIIGGGDEEIGPHQVEECESEAARLRASERAPARRQRFSQIFAQFGLFGHVLLSRIAFPGGYCRPSPNPVTGNRPYLSDAQRSVPRRGIASWRSSLLPSGEVSGPPTLAGRQRPLP